MEIKSIKLKYKNHKSKRIDIKAEGYKDTLVIYTFDYVMCLPYIDRSTDQGYKDFNEIEKIAFECYYWLITDDSQINNYNEEDWNEWIEKFSEKNGFKNSQIKELARNSFNTYKKFL